MNTKNEMNAIANRFIELWGPSAIIEDGPIVKVEDVCQIEFGVDKDSTVGVYTIMSMQKGVKHGPENAPTHLAAIRLIKRVHEERQNERRT